MKIFLIGFMGAGKSTIGKKLADKMNYHFIDVDTCIEKKEQMSIPAIFQEKGEIYFRQVEHDTLKEIADLTEDLIISTGGGAPCFMNNMELLNSSGLTIYIKLEPSYVFKRLVNAKKKNRPLIMNKSPEELMQFIIDKLKEREPVYYMSHIVVAGENLNIRGLEKRIRSFITDLSAKT